MTFTYEYPRPAVTTDCIILRGKDPMEVLLIQRKHEPFMGKWALPGGYVEIDEDIPEGAKRELQEETGLDKVDLVQFRTYGKPGRDPRGRTVSVVYYGFVDQDEKAIAGDDASNVRWFDITDLPALAFDHAEILDDFFRGMDF